MQTHLAFVSVVLYRRQIAKSAAPMSLKALLERLCRAIRKRISMSVCGINNVDLALDSLEHNVVLESSRNNLHACIADLVVAQTG